MQVATVVALWFGGASWTSALDAPDLHLRSKANIADPDYDVFPFHCSKTGASDLVWYEKSGNITSTGRPYVAHAAVFHPSFFAFYPPTSSGCVDYMKTSISSSTNYDCNLVSDSKAWVLEGMDEINFGITDDNEVITGFIDDVTYESVKFTQLLSGKGWLVRDGASYVASSTDLDLKSNFVLEKAPRTAVGIFANGSMILYEVDGEEDIDYGPDLFEMAELLVDLGVVSAVNIDGGGSSVSVYNGTVVSLPTCDDTPTICEREVQSIACVLRKM